MCPITVLGAQQTNLPSALGRDKIFLFQGHLLCKNPQKDNPIQRPIGIVSQQILWG